MKDSPAAFSLEQGANLPTFVGLLLAVGVPVDLLTYWLAVHIHDSPLVIFLFLLIAPVAGAAFGWVEADDSPRRVDGNADGVTLTMHSGEAYQVSWDDFRSAAIVGAPVWLVRAKVTGLPTLYSLVFLTFPQARAVLSRPSFPELYGLHEVRARLGITS